MVCALGIEGSRVCFVFLEKGTDFFLVQVGLIVTRNGKAEKLSDLAGKLCGSLFQYLLLRGWVHFVSVLRS